MTELHDEWLRAARARASRGEWERPADEIFSDLKRRATAYAATTETVRASCPFCAAHPPLLRFQRFELQNIAPLLYCGNCYGFWAKGDALARGVADAGYGHPALEAGVAPRRCRACFGHMKPDNTCAKCGQPLPPLNCPECAKVMERFETEGVSIDHCAACNGTWFDMGEIARVYGLQRAQGLAASTIDEHATDDEPSGWLIALNIAARLALPYLPL